MIEEGDLSRFKDNPKTAYFYTEYKRLLEEEAEVSAMQGELGDLAKDDLKRIEEQKAAVLAEMERPARRPGRVPENSMFGLSSYRSRSNIFCGCARALG